MNDPAFFGYGSLVNLTTHDYTNPRPAKLHGWRRVWQHTHLREVAYLSVEHCEDTIIDGIVANVPGGDWATLDRREAAYARHNISHQIRHEGPTTVTAVYQVEPKHAASDRSHPILLSYIDVVVQGFLQIYGPAGVADFFATTSGWDTPIKNDRAAPRYPRHQQLSPDETALVDRHLAAVMEQAE